MPLTIIVGLSLILQALSAALALNMTRITGWKTAWTLLSAGILSMGIRRLITFADLVAGTSARPPETGYELIGLLGSVLMLAGVIYIKPIFLELKESERHQRELAEELNTALSEVKTLSGLLPICSFCKKIRDDKGYWNQLETYISARSDTRFSHGMCPECAKKMYPQYFKDEES